MGNLFTGPIESPAIDNLIAGNLFPTQTTPVTLASGTAYLRGDLLICDADNEKYAQVTGPAGIAVDIGTGGVTTKRFAVLLDDVDATSADTIAAAALTGEFNVHAMRFAVGTWEDYVVPCSNQGIFLKENNPAPVPADFEA